MDHLFSISTIIFIGLILLFYGMAYLILNKQAYFLISGFNTRSENEQKELIKQGFPQATDKLMLIIGIILTMGLVFHLVQVRYALDAAMIVMILLVFGGFIYLQKYEIPEKRKRGYGKAVLITLLSLLVVGAISISGFSSPKVTMTDNAIHISGMYGIEWSIDSIENVELLDELPQIKRRTNGFAFAGHLKGYFLLEELGKGKLFIQGDQKPYLLVQANDTYVILNGEQVEDWYHMLKEAIVK